MGKSRFSDENGAKKVLFSRSAKKVLGMVVRSEQVGSKQNINVFMDDLDHAKN